MWNPARCICENGKYVTSVMDESGISVIKLYSHMMKIWKLSRTTKQILIKRKQPEQRKVFIFYLPFY